MLRPAGVSGRRGGAGGVEVEELEVAQGSQHNTRQHYSLLSPQLIGVCSVRVSCEQEGRQSGEGRGMSILADTP